MADKRNPSIMHQVHTYIDSQAHSPFTRETLEKLFTECLGWYLMGETTVEFFSGVANEILKRTLSGTELVLDEPLYRLCVTASELEHLRHDPDSLIQANRSLLGYMDKHIVS